MKLKYITRLNQLSSQQRQEIQNLMDESGMFYGKQLNEFIAPEDYKSAVCVSNTVGEVCGFAFIEDEESAIVLSHLYVSPAMRKHGIGSSLVKCVKNFARQSGAKKVELAVEKSNNNAKALYEKEGFEVQRSHNDKYIMSVQVKSFEK